MKKAVAMILALVLCISMCACGSNSSNSNSKYVGAYSNSNQRMRMNYPDQTNYWRTEAFDGTCTLTLNSDGTGSQVFVAHTVPYVGNSITVYNCPITWEVVDDYLYISGSCTSPLNSQTYTINDRYILQGKTLADADDPDSKNLQFTKQN